MFGKTYIITTLLWSAAIVFANGTDQNIETPSNKIPTVAPVPVPTEAPITFTHKTSTAPPKTTTLSPKTTTLTPKTTTSTPKTTTSAPNTTTSAPNTTTASTPITTTTARTTTIKPTLPPTPVDPSQGKWTVNYTNSTTPCIILNAAIQIELDIKVDNKTKKTGFNVPTNASATGNCEKENQTILLRWTTDDNVTNQISFSFIKNNSKFNLSEIDVNLAELKLSHNATEFSTPIKKSYKCYKRQYLNLTTTAVNTTAILKIDHVQLQAFHSNSTQNFDEAIDCADSETPDVVPIAVGCALAALVIIVLVAYLIGRRRSQARGYLSIETTFDD